jgi:hypothetical protein
LLASSIDGQELEYLARVVEALLSSGVVWVVATLRSDFLERFEAALPLQQLANRGATYLLKLPNDAEIDQMIRGPALAAGLRFEVSAISGIELSQEVRIAAVRNPSGLPLLEFLLSQLWERRDGQVLTYSAYESLGGLDGGAIGRRAEEVFQEQPENVKDAFPTLLRALVDVGNGRDSRPVARTFPAR